MPVFEENGISISFENNYFRFAECQDYKNISNKKVKEMDFVWIDKEKKTLWLVELKGFINPNPENKKFQETDLDNKNTLDNKLQELLKKSIHSVCMINNERSKTENCIKPKLPTSYKIKILHILNIKKEHRHFLKVIKIRFMKDFEPFEAIFRVDSVSIADYETAKKIYKFVV